MKRALLVIVVAAFMSMMSACKTVDPNYLLKRQDTKEVRDAQIEKERRIAEEKQAERERQARAEELRLQIALEKAKVFAVAAQKCTDASCIGQVMMGTALDTAISSNTQVVDSLGTTLVDTVEAVDTGTGGGNNYAQLANFQPQKGAFATTLETVLGLAPIALGFRQSDNAVKTSQQMYNFWTAHSGNMANMVTDLQPNVNVGGDYVTGEYTHIEGGFIGGDASGAGSGIGNEYTDAHTDTQIEVGGNGNAVGDANNVDNSQNQNNGDANGDDRDNNNGDNRDNIDNRTCNAGAGGDTSAEGSAGTGGQSTCGG